MIVIDDDSPPSAAPDGKEGCFPAKRASEKREEDEEEWIQRGGSRCPICFLALFKDVAALMGCGHTFHLPCIEKWFKQRGGRAQKPSCPYCAKEYASRRYILSLHFDLPDPAARVSSLPSSSSAENEDPETRIRRLEMELREERREKLAAREEATSRAAAVEALEAREEELVRLLRSEEEQKTKLASRVETLEEARVREEESRENAFRTYEENRRVLEEKYQKLAKKCQTLQLLATVVKEDRADGATLLDKIRKLSGLTADEKLARIMPLVEFLKRSKAARTEEMKKLKKENFLLRRKLSGSALAEATRVGPPSESKREETSAASSTNIPERIKEEQRDKRGPSLPSSSSSASSSSSSASSTSSSFSSASSSSSSVSSSSSCPLIKSRSDRQREERRGKADVPLPSSRQHTRLPPAPPFPSLSRRERAAGGDEPRASRAAILDERVPRDVAKCRAKHRPGDAERAVDERRGDSDSEGGERRNGEIERQGGREGFAGRQANRENQDQERRAAEDRREEFPSDFAGAWLVGRPQRGDERLSVEEEEETSWRKRRRDDDEDDRETAFLFFRRRRAGDGRTHVLSRDLRRAEASREEVSGPSSPRVYQVEDAADAEEEEGWRRRRQRRQQSTEVGAHDVQGGGTQDEHEQDDEQTQLNSEVASLLEDPDTTEQRGEPGAFPSLHTRPSHCESPSRVLSASGRIHRVAHLSSASASSGSSSSSSSSATAPPSSSAVSPPFPVGSASTASGTFVSSASIASSQSFWPSCASPPLSRNAQTSPAAASVSPQIAHASSEHVPDGARLASWGDCPRRKEQIGRLSARAWPAGICASPSSAARSKQTASSVPSFIAHFLNSPSPSAEKQRTRDPELRDNGEEKACAFPGGNAQGPPSVSAVQTPQRTCSRGSSRRSVWQSESAELSAEVSGGISENNTDEARGPFPADATSARAVVQIGTVHCGGFLETAAVSSPSTWAHPSAAAGCAPTTVDERSLCRSHSTVPRAPDNPCGVTTPNILRESRRCASPSGVRTPQDTPEAKRAGSASRGRPAEDTSGQRRAPLTRGPRVVECVFRRCDAPERHEEVEAGEADDVSCESDQETVRDGPSDTTDGSSNENLKNEVMPSTSRDERRKWGSLQPYRPESLNAGFPSMYVLRRVSGCFDLAGPFPSSTPKGDRAINEGSAGRAVSPPTSHESEQPKVEWTELHGAGGRRSEPSRPSGCICRFSREAA
ncbi:putative zinc finger (C3HC4 RING finger) protein [Neospora caninum Liverpool]|uniref:Putative zinc finger (C3HC4 RING finger) protein n=1 Tax=Neospora caninum (strain Liverpool) TaxID=572307 RepID=F0VQV3_NEOCL|nr:putative zinc finger (C3HC4 RING finger) protein [Neospora caninum Liverpool]CBZ56100.1 putative zinc finger (C3HC4 RING finger) protein [Neospora caninum Liverpool]|eukprot:XP_003886126.1 putative zinc finger (C3HC4 RING finger) protein [Neospora caninum Liverpool]